MSNRRITPVTVKVLPPGWRADPKSYADQQRERGLLDQWYRPVRLSWWRKLLRLTQ